MIKIDKLQLLSPFPIHIEGIGNVKSPTIKEISNIGEKTYDLYTKILVMTKQQILEIIHYDIDTSNKTKYDLLIYDEKTRHVLESMMSFFICQAVVYDESINGLAVFSKINEKYQLSGLINRDNFESFCGVLKQLNYINIDDSQLVVKSKKAQEILDKINKAKKDIQKNKKKDQSETIHNMVSVLCVHHNSYNMTNIWELTINQLYDQFLRQNYKNQIDAYTYKWSSGWDSSDFDFSLWYKNIE